MPNKRSKNPGKRGAALLLVLGAVAILSILAITLSHRAQLDVTRSARTAREAAFRRALGSGVEIAKGILIERRKNPACDYWGEGWAEPIEATLENDLRITVQLSDESGKLNLCRAMMLGNASTADVDAARTALARLFAYLRLHDPARESDWQDAEAEVQQRLGITPGASARALLTLDGLRECGVPQELIFGSSTAPDDFRLCDLVTTFGDGLVNLNTAAEPVLYSLDEEYDENLAAAIVQWRGGNQDDPADGFLPFKTTQDLENVEGIVTYTTVNGQRTVAKSLRTKVNNRISTQSACFSARIQVTQGSRKRTAWAFFNVPQSGQTLTPANLKLVSYEEIEP